MGDQLLRSGTSILANHTEGQSASSKKEFANYMKIALKSCNESKVWFCLLRDTNRVKTDDVKPLLDEATEISKILASTILTLKKNLKTEASK